MFGRIQAGTAALALSLALAVAPAQARNVTADMAQIAEVMQGAGYNVEVKQAEGESFLSVDMESYRFLLLPFGCDDKGKNCKSVQFFAAFDPASSPSLEAMNAYARENRWGRIYLDKENDPAIEFDLDLEQGGMSPELFLDNVAYWEAVVAGYSKFVFGKDKD